MDIYPKIMQFKEMSEFKVSIIDQIKSSINYELSIGDVAVLEQIIHQFIDIDFRDRYMHNLYEIVTKSKGLRILFQTLIDDLDNVMKIQMNEN